MRLAKQRRREGPAPRTLRNRLERARQDRPSKRWPRAACGSPERYIGGGNRAFLAARTLVAEMQKFAAENPGKPFPPELQRLPRSRGHGRQQPRYT